MYHYFFYYLSKTSVEMALFRLLHAPLVTFTDSKKWSRDVYKFFWVSNFLAKYDSGYVTEKSLNDVKFITYSVTEGLSI